ncbi:hypothetical protein ACFOY2_28125 [Nonomuraea purpurea]|uniref:Uncharacterized protein n=1 Tax=Nonomuraea purpurea TaxID=1849276 RepID=A0ABV8GE01_9ACTN
MTAWSPPAHNLGDSKLSVRIDGRTEYPASIAFDGREAGIDLAVLEIENARVVAEPAAIGLVHRVTSVQLEPC